MQRRIRENEDFLLEQPEGTLVGIPEERLMVAGHLNKPGGRDRVGAER